MKRETSTLVIGPHGMLGRAVVEELSNRGLPFTAVGRERLDLLDRHCISKLPATFTHVINCAGYTQVDQAEQEEELATRINGDAVGQLATRCQAIGAVLVHYGSDYVFNGCATVPYRTDHPRDPVNAYGRSKANGEEVLESSGATFLCLRTSWLYAPWGNNFVLTMMNLTGKEPSLSVVDDQRGRPTSCCHLARTTLDLLSSGVSGFLHATDSGECTWFDFAQEINRQLGHDSDIKPCTSAEYVRPAKRPAYSVLDISQTEAITGRPPSWQENLREVLGRVSPASKPL